MMMRIYDRQSRFENRFFVQRKPILPRHRVRWRCLLLLCGRSLRPTGGRAADEHRKFAAIHWWPLVPRRWTHGDELEGSALGPRSVVVHLIGDIVDDAARPDGNDIVLVELRPRA